MSEVSSVGTDLGSNCFTEVISATSGDRIDCLFGDKTRVSYLYIYLK